MSARTLGLTSLSLMGLLTLSACGVLHSAATLPDPRDEWTASLAQADREVLASRFGVADRVLADFAERYPNTNESYDALFWRALYKLDPTNATATPRDAAALLDTYLAASLAVPHRGAATTLRRIAGALDKSGTAAVASTANASTPTTATDKSRDEELARLKDELAKANAELERIKRRVATPKP
jgi:hypothetical protein